MSAESGGRQRFIRFLLTSGAAAGVNIVARYLLEYVTNYEIAVAIAYLFGMVTAFVLARRFVFDAGHDSAGGQFARFALVNAIAFAQVWLVSVGLARLLFPAIGFTWQAETIAHVIGVASPAVTSYFLHQHFSFRAVRT
jgi:putative flippase GtrA